MKLSFDTMKSLMENEIGFIDRTGLKVLELQKGYVKCLMPLKENTNHIGTMYAGALFTLAEVPGGALYLSSFDTSKFYPIVKDLYINFVIPAKTDITVEVRISDEELDRIQDEAEKNGKAEFSLHGELKNENGKIVSTSKGLYQIRRFQSLHESTKMKKIWNLNDH